jgi:hypothetical protein
VEGGQFVQKPASGDVVVDPAAYEGLPVTGDIHLPALAGFGDDEVEALVGMASGAAAAALAAPALAGDE